MQLERIIHSQGFGSRKEVRGLIRAGALTVAGAVVDDPRADFAPEGLVFEVDGEPWQYRKQVYVLLHKPPGYECSRTPQFHPAIYALLPDPLIARGIQSVGRLDQDSTGLLLLSDDGQFIHYWSSGKKRIPKCYQVDLAMPADDGLAATLLGGVQLDDEPGPIAALACRQTGSRSIELTVTEGKYHQVKRMVAAAGNHVAALHRSRVGGLSLPEDLAEGDWCWLEEAQLAALADWN